MNALKLEPEMIVRRGKVEAVILGMDAYTELLERLEDVEDLRWLKAARRKPLEFRSLDAFLTEARARV